MNAFDLINMVGGAAVSRMFRAGEEEENKKDTPSFTQFPSQLQADMVVATWERVLEESKKKKKKKSFIIKKKSKT